MKTLEARKIPCTSRRGVAAAENGALPDCRRGGRPALARGDGGRHTPRDGGRHALDPNGLSGVTDFRRPQHQRGVASVADCQLRATATAYSYRKQVEDLISSLILLENHSIYRICKTGYDRVS
jgi:hypothetical protein